MTGWLFPNGQDRITTRKMLAAQMIIVGVVVLIVFLGVKFQHKRQIRLAVYTCTDGGYSILFPEPPVELCRLAIAPDGPIRFFVIQQRTEDFFCTIEYGDYPLEYSKETPGDVILDSIRDEIIKSNKGILQFETRFLLNNLPARRLQIYIEEATIHALLILSGRRQYQVIIVTATDERQYEQADDILQSMQITPPKGT
ncbi:MAG: hypothetical protein JXA82_14840 [Sedimentisphaerales bacterium]|nr:hypothetical protein [Sedimentisphaerales bacterium]